MPAAPLTDEEKQDAARLKAAFKAHQAALKARGEPYSQEVLAAEIGIGGQSVTSQYLNGSIPLNIKALYAFCRVIHRKPIEISPRLVAEKQLQNQLYNESRLFAALDGEDTIAPPESVALSLSPPRPIVQTQRLQWGDLVKEEQLPEHFELDVLDDAMAPIAPKGSVARFSTKLALDPGKKPVLLRDRDGNCYIRNYLVVRGTRWQAMALQPGFAPMDSEADGLVVLAVMRGIDWA